MNDADLDQLHGAQLAPVARRPSLVLHAEGERHSAQVAPLGQCQYIAPELGVGNVELECQTELRLREPQRAGGSARQQPAGVVVHQCQHVRPGRERSAERTGHDAFLENADAGRRVERRGHALQPAPGGAQLDCCAPLQAVRQFRRTDHATISVIAAKLSG